MNPTRTPEKLHERRNASALACQVPKHNSSSTGEMCERASEIQTPTCRHALSASQHQLPVCAHDGAIQRPHPPAAPSHPMGNRPGARCLPSELPAYAHCQGSTCCLPQAANAPHACYLEPSSMADSNTPAAHTKKTTSASTTETHVESPLGASTIPTEAHVEPKIGTSTITTERHVAPKPGADTIAVEGYVQPKAEATGTCPSATHDPSPTYCVEPHPYAAGVRPSLTAFTSLRYYVESPPANGAPFVGLTGVVDAIGPAWTGVVDAIGPAWTGVVDANWLALSANSPPAVHFELFPSFGRVCPALADCTSSAHLVECPPTADGGCYSQTELMNAGTPFASCERSSERSSEETSEGSSEHEKREGIQVSRRGRSAADSLNTLDVCPSLPAHLRYASQTGSLDVCPSPPAPSGYASKTTDGLDVCPSPPAPSRYASQTAVSLDICPSSPATSRYASQTTDSLDTCPSPGRTSWVNGYVEQAPSAFFPQPPSCIKARAGSFPAPAEGAAVQDPSPSPGHPRHRRISVEGTTVLDSSPSPGHPRHRRVSVEGTFILDSLMSTGHPRHRHVSVVNEVCCGNVYDLSEYSTIVERSSAPPQGRHSPTAERSSAPQQDRHSPHAHQRSYICCESLTHNITHGGPSKVSQTSPSKVPQPLPCKVPQPSPSKVSQASPSKVPQPSPSRAPHHQGAHSLHQHSLSHRASNGGILYSLEHSHLTRQSLRRIHPCSDTNYSVAFESPHQLPPLQSSVLTEGVALDPPRQVPPLKSASTRRRSCFPQWPETCTGVANEAFEVGPGVVKWRRASSFSAAKPSAGTLEVMRRGSFEPSSDSFKSSPLPFTQGNRQESCLEAMARKSLANSGGNCLEAAGVEGNSPGSSTQLPAQRTSSMVRNFSVRNLQLIDSCSQDSDDGVEIESSSS